MSKELTEQWRNGTIDYGLYYVRIGCRNDVTIAHTIEEDLNVKEVLAPVPSYEKSQSYEKCAEMLIDVNKKWEKTIKERNQLKNKLEIATKALEKYKRDYFFTEYDGSSINPHPDIARKALKEMEGVK